jgi:hypothetical protein
VEALNRQEMENLVADLYFNQKKTFRQIQQITRKSPRDIKVILDKADPGRSSTSLSSRAYKLFSEGKTPTDVAIALGIREPEASQFFREYWKLNQLYDLNQIYEETNSNFSSLVDLYKQMKAAGLSVEHVIKLIKLANNDIQSIEGIYQGLKREEACLNVRNLNAARTFQQLSNNISEENRILDHYRSSCIEERLKLAKLRIEKVRLESIVKQFWNSKEYLKIKEIVKQTVEHSLTNHMYILKLAFLSVIESCRNNPVKFNILYHNLPMTTCTTETRSLLSAQSSQCNYRLALDKQSHCQYINNNDDVYENSLLNDAKQFFNNMAEDLTLVCIDLFIGRCIFPSLSSELTKRPH